MALEVLTVAGTFVLAIISFNIALIALDIVEHVLMLMKKLGRILLEQFTSSSNSDIPFSNGCLYRNFLYRCMPSVPRMPVGS